MQNNIARQWPSTIVTFELGDPNRFQKVGGTWDSRKVGNEFLDYFARHHRILVDLVDGAQAMITVRDDDATNCLSTD